MRMRKKTRARHRPLKVTTPRDLPRWGATKKTAGEYERIRAYKNKVWALEVDLELARDTIADLRRRLDKIESVLLRGDFDSSLKVVADQMRQFEERVAKQEQMHGPLARALGIHP